MSSKVDEILEKYDESISFLGFQLREFILAQLNECIETPDLAANIIAYGYGPGYADTICTIIPSKKGMKLGFYRGSELHDPEKLLTGSGKVHRYVEIKTKKDVTSPALKKLMKEAIKAWESRKNTKLTK